MDDRYHSFEDDAERKCEEHLALAAQIDPQDPEVYQVSNVSLRFWS